MFCRGRQIVSFIKRIRNRLSSYYNLLRLNLYGIKYGHNCVIHGKLYINLFSSANVELGIIYIYLLGGE